MSLTEIRGFLPELDARHEQIRAEQAALLAQQTPKAQDVAEDMDVDTQHSDELAVHRSELAEVAEMLIDPVRGERADHTIAPPRGRGHLAAPIGRGIPVVAQIVIVEDHRRRDRRHQPAHLW